MIRLLLFTFALILLGINFHCLSTASLQRNVAHKRLAWCCFIVDMNKITATPVCLVYIFVI